MSEKERILSKTVEAIYGRGYVSGGAAAVFQCARLILSHIPQEKWLETASAIAEMCIAVGSEAAEVGFEVQQ